jgi:hypothetical protein
MTDYNLVYYRRLDQKKFLVRRILNAHYVMLDPDNLEKVKITYAKLKENFVPCKDNLDAIKKISSIRVRK